MNGGPWDHVGAYSLKPNGAIVSNTGAPTPVVTRRTRGLGGNGHPPV